MADATVTTLPFHEAAIRQRLGRNEPRGKGTPSMTSCMTWKAMATPASIDEGSKSDDALCRRSEDSREIQELKARLNALTEVGAWRLEQLKISESDKRAAEKTLEEKKLFAEMSQDQFDQNIAQKEALQKLYFTLMNGKHADGNNSGLQEPQVESDSVRKLERSLNGLRDQLKLRSEERDKWKTKCKKMEDDASCAPRQIKQLTKELKSCKAVAAKLTNERSTEENLEEVCRDLREQLEQHNTALQRSAAKSLNMREKLKLRSEERDKWKTKCKKMEDAASCAQGQIRQLTMELQSCKAEAAKLANERSAEENLEVCRDSREQLEQHNTVLQQRWKAKSSTLPELSQLKGQKLAELRQDIQKRDEEIGKFKRVKYDQIFPVEVSNERYTVVKKYTKDYLMSRRDLHRDLPLQFEIRADAADIFWIPQLSAGFTDSLPGPGMSLDRQSSGGQSRSKAEWPPESRCSQQ